MIVFISRVVNVYGVILLIIIIAKRWCESYQICQRKHLSELLSYFTQVKQIKTMTPSTNIRLKHDITNRSSENYAVIGV